MNSRRTYFLCPHFDYPVDSISLGHIIASPSDPSNPLNVDEVVEPDQSDVVHYDTNGFKLDGRMRNSTKGGVLRVFLRVFGFGGDSERGRSDVFEFEHLDTKFFNPTDEYLRRATRAEGVQRFLAASRFRKPIYLITGVKIVSGARSSRSLSWGQGRAEIPFEAVTPIVVGAGVEVSLGWSESKSFDAPLDFVFAFQLAKLRFSRQGEMICSVMKSGALVENEPRLEDAGVGDVRAAVAEKIHDVDNKNYVVVYSAERPISAALRA